MAAGGGERDGRARSRLESARESVDDAMGRVRDSVDDAVDRVREVVKPRLRGWLHAGTFPVAMIAGILLVAFASSATARITVAIYTITAGMLFGVSALYHRGNWTGRADRALQRIDHANIFLIIAGTYTPFAALLLEPGRARLLLWIVWAGALLGVAFRVFWIGAPRWIYTPVYIALGWVAVLFLPDMLSRGGWLVLTLLLLGGVLYTAGGLVYAMKRPDPSPRWFGFHEVFHAFTLAAFLTHYIALCLVVAYSPA